MPTGVCALRRVLLSTLALVAVSLDVEASCVDPAMRVASTVSITREFSDEERIATPSIVGVRGTGWFYSKRSLVTAAHVADAMLLRTDEWKTIQVQGGEARAPIRAR